MKTFMPSEKDAQNSRAWYILDIEGQVLGRVASQVASILRGKHKPEYTPFIDCGDHVIIVNAAAVHHTGRKKEQKIYYRHTNYPGGIKEMTAQEMIDKKPEEVIRLAVKRMLPKGALGRKMLTKLKVYRDDAHPHQAQKPQPLELQG
ncbi:MAG: 50S ribosomal protein L13 [Myxococcota bacterium]